MSLMTIAVLGIVVLLILMFLGMNIGLAMMLVGFIGYGFAVNWKAAYGVLQTVPYTQAASYSMTVVPLFIMMGNFAFASGMSENLYSAANKWVGRLPGGLACATTVACAAFGAICGSTNATTATMGVVAIPEMRKYGYKDTLSCGSVAVGGGLGIMIPPSTCFIAYGIMAELSIGRLFAAGILPGILITVLIVITIVVQVKISPSLAPKGDRYTWKERWISLAKCWDVLILFIGVFWAMFSGIFTINEAAAAGALLAMILMAIKRKLTFTAFKKVMWDSIKTTAMTYLIVIGAMVFGSFLTITQMPMKLAAIISGLDVSKYLILAAIVVVYVILGCFMDALPMIMLTVPIFLPIVTGLGFDAIWFGVIIIIVMMIGFITPPVGMNCYVLSGIVRDVPLFTIFRGSVPYLIPLLVSFILITIFPQIALVIPNMLYG
ncbi:MAG: TRAP transporter large permease [Oscillospiraceae bacterium]|nr:TRAP transporter large permease [Oscillospiraceae bacterium]